VSQKQAKVAAWETTLLKTLPLVLLALIILETPAIGVISEDAVDKAFRVGMMIFIMLAFLVELGYSLPDLGMKGHFGTPLLAVFAMASLVIGINFWFEFYSIGSNAQIDAFVYLFFLAGILLLIWQARTEYFKHEKLKLAIFKKFSR